MIYALPWANTGFLIRGLTAIFLVMFEAWEAAVEFRREQAGNCSGH
jgi:hypothetical protein